MMPRSSAEYDWMRAAGEGEEENLTSRLPESEQHGLRAAIVTRMNSHLSG